MACLYLSEDDVAALVDMPLAIASIEAAFLGLALGHAENVPRHRSHVRGQAMLHVMSAAAAYRGYLGCKMYVTSSAGAQFLVGLVSAAEGRFIALLSSDRLGRQRTGAASGVATRWLSRPESQVMACLGAGGQAESQIEAVCHVRSLSEVRIVSRRIERAVALAERMIPRVGVPCRALNSAEEAVQGADIVTTITTSREPVLHGDWLAAGMHVNLAGGNHLQRSEADAETFRRATRVVCDDRDACLAEAGELHAAAAAGTFDWSQASNLCDVVRAASSVPSRSTSEITVFKSVGLALEDVALAADVYEAALSQKRGQLLPF